MEFAKAYLAGFIATLSFHQGMLALLHSAGLSPKAAWAMDPTLPLRIPAVISLAGWGGAWGIALWLLIREQSAAGYWTTALLFGAIAPSIVALGLVFPLKGMPFAGGWDPKIIGGALLLNGAWGLGTALFLRIMLKNA